MRAFMLAAAVLIAGAAPAFAECDPGETKVVFAHVAAAKGHPKGEAAERLAARINDEMNGKLCMEVHPNSTLVGDDKIMDALAAGTVQLGAPSLSLLEPYTGKFRVFDLPFLFKDLAAVDRFAASDTGKTLLHAMDDKGYVGIAYWFGGLKQFSANKPLVLPTDAMGLTFRIQPSEMSEAMITALGATSVKLAFGEVFKALKDGKVNGQENSWSNIYTQKFYEVQDGVTETNHQNLAYLLLMAKPFYDGLDPAVRDQFLKIVGEVTTEANARIADIEATNRKAIAATGEGIRVLSPAERQAWVDAVQPVWNRFKGDIGQDAIDAALAANGS